MFLINNFTFSSSFVKYQQENLLKTVNAPNILRLFCSKKSIYIKWCCSNMLCVVACTISYVSLGPPWNSNTFTFTISKELTCWLLLFTCWDVMWFSFSISILCFKVHSLFSFIYSTIQLLDNSSECCDSKKGSNLTRVLNDSTYLVLLYVQNDFQVLRI